MAALWHMKVFVLPLMLKNGSTTLDLMWHVIHVSFNTAQQSTRFECNLRKGRTFIHVELIVSNMFLSIQICCTSSQIIDHGSNQSMTSGGGILKTKT